jgi:hypothetical protein
MFDARRKSTVVKHTLTGGTPRGGVMFGPAGQPVSHRSGCVSSSPTVNPRAMVEVFSGRPEFGRRRVAGASAVDGQ